MPEMSDWEHGLDAGGLRCIFEGCLVAVNARVCSRWLRS
jgi:hypothetical protein